MAQKSIFGTNIIQDAFNNPELTGGVVLIDGNLEIAPGNLVDGVDVSEIVSADGLVSTHSDVTILSPILDEVLQYDGAQWVNQYLPPINDAGDALNELLSSNKINSVITILNTKVDDLTTTEIEEGTNLYYTDARVDTEFDVRLATKNTTDLAEGINLYYTNARVDTEFDVRLATKNTTNLAEGSNLYYTDARVSASVDVNANTTHRQDSSVHFTQDSIDHTLITNRGTNTHADIDDFINSVGQDSGLVPLNSSGKIDASFFALDSDDIIQGVSNLYYTPALSDLKYDKTGGDVSGAVNLNYVNPALSLKDSDAASVNTIRGDVNFTDSLDNVGLSLTKNGGGSASLYNYTTTTSATLVIRHQTDLNDLQLIFQNLNKAFYLYGFLIMNLNGAEIKNGSINDSLMTHPNLTASNYVKTDGTKHFESLSSIPQSDVTGLISDLSLKANLSNPTFTGTVSGVSKAMVGLPNVDDVSDADKPVSTAHQTALDLKANLANPTFTGTVSGVSKTMVGLSNVDNTSDANKPVSTAQQTALNLKLNKGGDTMTGKLQINNSVAFGNGAGLEVSTLVTQTSGSLVNITGTAGQVALHVTSGDVTVDNKLNVKKDVLIGGDRIMIEHPLTPMTSANTPTPYAVSESVFQIPRPGWYAFGQGTTNWWWTKAYNASGFPTGAGSTVVNSVSVAGEWVQLDMGSVKSNNTAYKFVGPSTIWGNFYPTSWVYAGSNDQVTWTQIDSKTDFNSFTLNVQEQFNHSPVSYRYFRFIVTKKIGGGVDSALGGFEIIEDTGTYANGGLELYGPSPVFTVNEVIQDTAKDIWLSSVDTNALKSMSLIAGQNKMINVSNSPLLVVNHTGSVYGYFANVNSYSYTINVTGYYKIDANCNFSTDDDNASNYTCFGLFINNATTRYCSKNAKLKDRMVGASINATVFLNADDVFSLRFMSVTGVNLLYDNVTMSMLRLRVNI